MDNKLKEWTDTLDRFTKALGEIVRYLQESTKNDNQIR